MDGENILLQSVPQLLKIMPDTNWFKHGVGKVNNILHF